MSSTVELLRKARDLIEQKGWTRGAYARTAGGTPVPVHDPDACRFCSVGALIRASLDTPESSQEEYDTARRLFVRQIKSFASDDTVIPAWNDAPSRTVFDVLAAFDRAVQDAEKEIPA